MCAAINLSRGTSAIAVMIDNARALITTLSIICLHFVFHDFSFIFVMESEDKYKTSGGNSCAVHACSNNRKKIILWKKSMCELHGQIHDQCPCLIPYRLHVMPSKESIRLEWIKALNRKELPKKYLSVLNILSMENQPIGILILSLSWDMKSRPPLVDERH